MIVFIWTLEQQVIYQSIPLRTLRNIEMGTIMGIWKPQYATFVGIKKQSCKTLLTSLVEYLSDTLILRNASSHTYSNDVMVEISVHDRYNPGTLYGILKLRLNLSNDGAHLGRWCSLLRKKNCVAVASGEIYLSLQFRKTEMHDVGRNDFEILKMIGSGAYGRVYQVRRKANRQIYAMKVLMKKEMIRKKGTTHVISERNVLVQAAMECPPFIIPLRYCFQTRRNLYMVTDYMPGGDLFWHMLNEGRFRGQRVKFYVSELVLALEYLHGQDIVYP